MARSDRFTNVSGICFQGAERAAVTRSEIPRGAQLCEGFLSSKHQDYQAAIAEFSSAERA